MPRPPREGAIPRPTRTRGVRAGRRVEVWFTPAEDVTLAEHLGRRATAADVRTLALKQAQGGDDDRK